MPTHDFTTRTRIASFSKCPEVFSAFKDSRLLVTRVTSLNQSLEQPVSVSFFVLGIEFVPAVLVNTSVIMQHCMQHVGCMNLHMLRERKE